MLEPLIVSEVNGFTPPTAPDKVTGLPVKLSVCMPLIVLLNVIVDPLAVTGPVSATAPVISIGLLVVVKLLAKVMAPV